MIKLSVNETKWRSLLARTRALILYISFWIFDFGPVKLPGLSRNGPLQVFFVFTEDWQPSLFHFTNLLPHILEINISLKRWKGALHLKWRLYLDTVAGEALSMLWGSNTTLQFGAIGIRSPFASVRVLLSSNTLLRFSIQIASTGPSRTIHMCSPWNAWPDRSLHETDFNKSMN